MNGPMMSPAPPGIDFLPIPPKVRAAQDYLYYANSVRNGGQSDGYNAGAELSDNEQGTYDSALEVLRLYFKGEMEFEPVFAVFQQAPDDDEPQPEKVTA